jgi:cell division protein FtsB
MPGMMPGMMYPGMMPAAAPNADLAAQMQKMEEERKRLEAEIEKLRLNQQK